MNLHAPVTPYPDELGYSVIARSLRQWRYAHNPALLEEIFGGPPPAINIVAPSRLPVVASALGGMSARDFAAKHTLLPYYFAFVPTRARSAGLRTLLSKTNACTAQIALTGAFEVAEPKYLRFCPDCVHRDRTRYGETFWHRSHQLPGVHECPRDRRLLRSSTVPYRPDGDREYWAADHTVLLSRLTKRATPAMGNALSKFVLDTSIHALGTGLRECAHIGVHGYRATLVQQGYRDRRGRIQARRFADDFLSFMSLNRCDARTVGHDDWWLKAVRPSNRGATLPLHHLLLRAFLGELRTKGAEQKSLFE